MPPLQLRQGQVSPPTIAVHAAQRPRITWRDYGPHRVITSLTDNFDLIMQLTGREIAARYRGSALGVLWSFVTPILMLAIYTFVFSVVFQTRWNTSIDSRFEFAMILFAGLIVFYLFSECVGRAPTLLLENPSYIKRIVFPLEALGWVVMLNALFNALISSVILVAAFTLMVSAPPLTVLWLPLVITPFILFTLGLVWFLSATGVYVRDVRQLVGIILPMLMFASPLFYPLSALPAAVRGYMGLNPLASAMENVRSVALFGNTPDMLGLGLTLALSLVVAWAGLAWLLATKRGFADVV
jgi:lipopolysaccharide transport system permease protein